MSRQPNGLRRLEKILDERLRHDPPTTGRAWRELSADGIHRQCSEPKCGVIARVWIGAYYVRSDHGISFPTKHESGPLCAVCATVLQHKESELPHLRDPVVETA